MKTTHYRTVKIFIASSTEDTEKERAKLQNKILSKWNPIFERFNLQFKVFKCEDLSSELGENCQKIIDEEIRSSDIFVLIFKNQVGEYTFHEFQIAKDTAKSKGGIPHIFPFVSYDLMQHKNDIPELVKLTEEDTYCKTFENFDTVLVCLLEDISNVLSLDLRFDKEGRIFLGEVETDFDIDPREISKEALISQQEYIQFAADKLGALYYDSCYPLVKYHEQVFPDIVIEADDSVRGFDAEQMNFLLQNNSRLLMNPTHPISPDFMEELKQSYRIRKPLVQRSYCFYDFMHDQFQLSASGKIAGVDMYVGPDADNVFSTLTLRDEFETIYENRKDAGIGYRQQDFTDPAISPIRSYVHKGLNASGITPLVNGGFRSSAPGLQLIVLFKVNDKRKARIPYLRPYVGSEHYWTPLIKRADHVREQPGFYQFAPCGTFRIHAEPEIAEKDRHIHIQEQYFNFYDAIVYHYVHELFSDVKCKGAFGDSKYDIPEHAVLNDAVHSDPHAEELWDMIEQGQAQLEFLGASVSLIALKYDFVFLLVIDDEDYYVRNKSQFRSDYNASTLDVYPLEYLSENDFLKDQPWLAQEIAEPLQLLKHSKLLKQKER